MLPEGSVPERYRTAAQLFEDWLRAEILCEDDSAAVYVYRQRSRLTGGARSARWALLAALRLSPFEAGEVLPHERTHHGPKEDRLALMRATRAQLSSVFLIARDRARAMGELFANVSTAPPLLGATTPDGNEHQLWRIDGAPAAALCRAAGADPLLIADGHHRYETALAFAGEAPQLESATRVLASIVAANDPGLVVLPTHRAIDAVPPTGGWVAALAGLFEMSELAVNGRAVAAAAEATAAAVAERPGPFIGMVEAQGGRAHLLTPRPEALAASDLSAAERLISSAVLDRLALGAALGSGPEELAGRGVLSYHREPAHAAAAIGAAGVAFLLPRVSVEDVWRAVEQGVRLPPKSTYFAPKMPTGLVFRSLVPAADR